MLEPREPITKNVTLRVRASELKRLDMAAEMAGVTRSRILREGGLKVAREVLREAADGDGNRDD